jgi:hypothetical protein
MWLQGWVSIVETMFATATRTQIRAVDRPREQVSFGRLLWVAPLTLVAALAVCFAIRSIVLALDPSLARMGQLQMPMFTLTIEGTLAAIVVFAVFAAVLPRPIFWYRIVGAVALLASLIPDVALALGGTPMMTAMRVVGPLATIGASGPGGAGGPPAGGPPAGGPPPGFMTGMPIEQVLVLMLLHASVALVSIGFLTTLTRKRAVSAS